VRTSEILMRTVDAPRRKKLFGSDHAERFAELVPDEMLPPVAARQREIRGLGVSSALQPGNDLGVFIIRMSTDHEHAAPFVLRMERERHGKRYRSYKSKNESSHHSLCWVKPVTGS